MDIAQENFDRACSSGYATLKELTETTGDLRGQIRLSEIPTRKLRTVAWDLEAIAAALHMELNNRLVGPDAMDTA